MQASNLAQAGHGFFALAHSMNMHGRAAAMAPSIGDKKRLFRADSVVSSSGCAARGRVKSSSSRKNKWKHARLQGAQVCVRRLQRGRVRATLPASWSVELVRFERKALAGTSLLRFCTTRPFSSHAASASKVPAEPVGLVSILREKRKTNRPDSFLEETWGMMPGQAASSDSCTFVESSEMMVVASQRDERAKIKKRADTSLF